jgi:hypothetical protein
MIYFDQSSQKPRDRKLWRVMALSRKPGRRTGAGDGRQVVRHSRKGRKLQALTCFPRSAAFGLRSLYIGETNPSAARDDGSHRVTSWRRHPEWGWAYGPPNEMNATTSQLADSKRGQACRSTEPGFHGEGTALALPRARKCRSFVPTNSVGPQDDVEVGLPRRGLALLSW